MDALSAKLAKHDFFSHYSDLCALYSRLPLTAIQSGLIDAFLELHVDRLSSADWKPLTEAIKVNKNLKFIALRSSYKLNITDEKGLNARKAPAIHSKDLSFQLFRALKECIGQSSVLTCLELNGLCLTDRDIVTLAKGLLKSRSLQHISLENCSISDQNLEVIAKSLFNCASIKSLNLANCALSWRAAESLAGVVKHQGMTRHNEAWKDSLRYEKPMLDRMDGLRRITLNHNAGIGDQGALALADAIKDDLWVKAIDMQGCGLSQVGGEAMLNVLKYNTTLVVVDVRQNPQIEKELMHDIMAQVLINSNGQDADFRWLKLGKGKSDEWFPRHLISPQSFESSPPQGIPWRTAERAKTRGGLASPRKNRPGSQPVCQDSSPLHSYTDLDGSSLSVSRKSHLETSQLHHRLRQETSARILAEKQLAEVEAEKEVLRRRLESIQQHRSVLDEEHVLQSIESSFRQFHAFLDLLREAGFGQLITLAGLDQTLGSVSASLNMPMPHCLSQQQQHQQQFEPEEEAQLSKGSQSS